MFVGLLLFIDYLFRRLRVCLPVVCVLVVEFASISVWWKWVFAVLVDV